MYARKDYENARNFSGNMRNLYLISVMNFAKIITMIKKVINR